MAVARCHCGAEIGGENHQPVAGATVIGRENYVTRAPQGYVLQRSDSVNTNTEAFRNMEHSTIRVVRFFVHALLFARAVLGEEDCHIVKKYGCVDIKMQKWSSFV